MFFFFIFAAYFLIILLFSMAKSPKIENTTFNLFKSMFPSWKFFDESVDTPVLLYRTKLATVFSQWEICVPHPEKKWFHLLYNPHGNFYLAYHSHIQQLLGDLTTFEDSKLESFHQHVSYKTTENFVRYTLMKKKCISLFQFKISSVKINDDGTLNIIEDVLISPELL